MTHPLHRNIPVPPERDYNHWFGVWKATHILKLQLTKDSIGAEEIVQIVCQKFGILRERLKERSRELDVLIPRHLCYYLISKKMNIGENKMSLKKITKFIGANQDHSTVIHAIRRVQDELDVNGSYAPLYRELMIEVGIKQ
jgi:chromosomal replication initiation ATPase DnaA